MDLIRISKFISLILRHKPDAIGITLDKHGWANVEELIKGVGIDIQTLEQIVVTDNKQRYSFNEDKTLIRANQGHSVDIDLGLTEVEPPSFLWHGTGEKYLNGILSCGLIPKTRQYVHLSFGVDTAYEVGSRHGNPVLIRVNAGQMYQDGYKFYVSANGVWLTESVPIKYLEFEGDLYGL